MYTKPTISSCHLSKTVSTSLQGSAQPGFRKLETRLAIRTASQRVSRLCMAMSSVLLWWFWIGFLFVFIKACSQDATFIIRFFCIIMLKPKKWFMNQWIWKELCTSQNKTLSTFSLSPHVQVLQMLARSFIKFILWALNKFTIELNRKLVQSAVNWSYYCTVKELIFSSDFSINDLIDSNQVIQSTWQTNVADTRC